jgi:hypothetical protein
MNHAQSQKLILIIKNLQKTNHRPLQQQTQIQLRKITVNTPKT